MNDATEKPTKKCERYNSFQNFWRKLCYNLGHSSHCEPEVRVVPCIPIDVSQLQERIQTLEWEIANKKRRAKETPATNVCASLVTQIFKPLSTEAPHLNFNEFPPLDDIYESPEMDCSHHQVPVANSKLVTPQKCSVLETIEKPPTVSRHTVKSHKIYKDQEYLLSRPLEINSKIKTERKPIKSKKVKRSNEYKKCDINNRHAPAPLIYYAQTVGSPFEDIGPCNHTSTYQQDCASISHAYLEEMIRKQYKPEPLINNSLSQFSTPVCREIDEHYNNAYPHDTDICSCCRGKFQNIDHELRERNRNRLQDPFLNCMYSLKRDTINKYYNSNDYDVIPVKELPVSKKLYRKEPRKVVDVICCPENIRLKPKLYHWLGNYPTTATSKIRYLQDPPTDDYEFNMSKSAAKHSKKIERAKINAATESTIAQNAHTSYDTQLVSPQTRELKPTSQKNIGCLTLNYNNIECQTVTTKSIQLESVPIRDINNKTEVTLGQIKCILQTVLNEVKNNQIKNASEVKSTRDAVVKKEVSQNTMTSSSKLIQSCTYSPYNMCPYMPSYSYPYQLPSGSLCCPNMPLATFKCLQNYPVLVETPHRLYNNNSKQPKVTRSVFTINETDVTTNTEPNNNEINRETNKLIEDIYKSLAIDLEIPSKDVTCNKALKKKSEQLTMRKSNTDVCAMVNVDIANNDIKDDNAATKSTTVNNVVNNVESARLHMINPLKTDTEYKILKLKNSETHCNDKYFKNVQNDENLLTNNFMQSDDDATLTEYTETSETESETEEALSVVESIKKKQKKGLFSKMFNAVKIFRMKGEKKNAQDSESESETDNSEDYETIIVEPKHTKYTTNKSRTATETKGTLNRNYREIETNPKIVTTPYNREYRRHWEEKWMPHNDSTGIYHAAYGGCYGPHVLTGRPVYKLRQHPVADNCAVSNKPHPVAYNSPSARSAALKDKKNYELQRFSKKNGVFEKKKIFKCAPDWKKLMLS